MKAFNYPLNSGSISLALGFDLYLKEADTRIAEAVGDGVDGQFREGPGFRARRENVTRRPCGYSRLHFLQTHGGLRLALGAVGKDAGSGDG